MGANMLNDNKLRLLRRNGAFEEPSASRMSLNWPVLASAGLMLALMTILLSSCACAGQISDTQAVRAILGESEGESITGMIALGEVIRKRGSMRGIYGYNAVKYVNGRYMRGSRAISPTLAKQALKAWKTSANTNYALNAQGWGNANDLKVFKRQKWFSRCIIVTKIGSHYFWRAKA